MRGEGGEGKPCVRSESKRGVGEGRGKGKIREREDKRETREKREDERERTRDKTRNKTTEKIKKPDEEGEEGEDHNGSKWSERVIVWCPVLSHQRRTSTPQGGTCTVMGPGNWNDVSHNAPVVSPLSCPSSLGVFLFVSPRLPRADS